MPVLFIHTRTKTAIINPSTIEEIKFRAFFKQYQDLKVYVPDIDSNILIN